MKQNIILFPIGIIAGGVIASIVTVCLLSKENKQQSNNFLKKILNKMKGEK